MKVKIRGLVFVGFAAAVFAQSALATDPAYNTSNQAADEKTVTSKYYVDGKFEQPVGNVLIQGANRGQVTSAVLGNDVSYINATTGNNVPVSGKAVKEAINALDSSIGGAVYTEKVEVTDGNSNVIGHNIVLDTDMIADDGAGNDSEMIADNGSHLTTVSAVMDYSETLTNKLEYDNGETITDNYDDNTKYPTAQNVYEFVKAENAAYQPKVAEDNTNSILRVGQWVPANGSDPSAQGYIPAHADWVQIRPYVTGGQNTGVGYITITDNTSRGVYDINLNNDMTVTTGSDLLTAGASSTGTDNKKLATAKSVYDLLDREGNGAVTTISASSGDDEVPTSKNVFDFVMGQVGGNSLPTMNPDCYASDGVHCALVTNYHAADAAHNNLPYATLEWTVMAQ